MQNYKYEAFISYRHIELDMQVARALHKQLETFSIPAVIKKSSGKNKVGTIFRDQDELPTSNDLGGSIRNALEQSNWLIVICSPALPQSKWCMEEIDSFISQGRGDHILTLLIDGEPSKSFPKQLRFTEVNGQVIEREPLAADIRARDLKSMLKRLKIEKLRLLAPMLGVKFDDLRQRARERRKKQIALISACALLAAAIFGGIYSIQYKKAQQALHEVNITKAAELLSQAKNYYNNGQQAAAVRTAAECLTLQTSLGLDTLSGESILYGSIVNFPENSSIASLTHTGTVNGAAFSQDGAFLATISNKDFLTVWDVHTAEAVYAKQLARLWEPATYDGSIIGLYGLKFTKDNELILSMPTGIQDFADSLSVYRFDQKGKELFSYHSSTLSYSARAGMVVWEDAGVIMLTGYGGLNVLNLENGSLISEKPLGGDIPWFELNSVAGKYLTLASFTNSSDICNLSVDVFTAESVKTGEAYKSFSFSVPLYSIDSMIPLDDENVVISNKSEIYLYNMASQKRVVVGEFSNMEMKYPLLLTCSEPYHFVAGYQDYAINEFSYDPTVGRITPTNDFTLGTNPGYIADLIVWADKNASVLSFLLKNTGNSGKWVLSDGTFFYRFNNFDMEGITEWVSSENGTVAAVKENSNVCCLYDVTVEREHLSFNRRDTQYIRQPMYLDSKDNFIVYQGFENGKGYYFSVGSFSDGTYAEDKRAYISGTETWQRYDMLDVKAPYDQVVFGENEAVLLVSEENNERSLLRLDYAGCTFQKLNQFTAEYPKLITMNEKMVVVCTSNGVSYNAYDLKTGELVNSSPEGPIYWNTVEHYGRPAPNIAFWVWLDAEKTKRLRWSYIDFDTGEFVDMDENAMPNAEVFISDDGYTAYFYGDDGNIAIFDLHTFKVTGYIKPGQNNLIDIQYVGGDMLAMVTKQNDIRFYDMAAQKEVAILQGLTDNVTNITYNARNGLAGVMGKTTLEIFDVKNNVRHTGTILFADRLTEESSYTAYIADDARYFYLVSHDADSENNTGLWYYCSPATYRLYTDEELLQLAAKYGYNQ